MVPAHAPLPTDCSLPFQALAGIQTSIPISESFDGFSVAVTRQNAGRRLYTAPAFGPRPPGGVGNAPAATGSAAVTVVFGNTTEATLSHEGAAASNSGEHTKTANRAFRFIPQ